MAQILFISHRIPYPPNKGDKIRAFQMIQNLKKLGHNVCCAFPIEHESDLSHTYQLKNFVDKIIHTAKPISTYRKMAHGVASLLTDQPLTKGLGYSIELETLLKNDNMHYDIVIFYSSVSFFYATSVKYKYALCDFVDVDSYKWHEYAQSTYFPMSWIYRREYTLLKKIEQEIASQVDMSLFVTENEKNLFLSEHKEKSFKNPIKYLECSVDSNRFNPDFQYLNPFLPQHKDSLNFVMTGVMDYKPNVDGALFFINEVMPHIIQMTNKKIGFYCVGRNPSKKLLKYHDTDKNIVITGNVDDVRPYINHSFACVAPLFIGRGIQNKVLEAMSMAKACFVSTNAFDGIDAKDNKHLIVCRDIHEWHSKIVHYIKSPLQLLNIGKMAHAHVEERYSVHYICDKTQEIINQLLEQSEN